MRRIGTRLSYPIVFSAALFLILAAARANVETAQASNGTTVTRILVNGRSADVLLVDNITGAQGFVSATEDQIAQTAALDFSYAFPHPTDPDLLILIQGAGEIPLTAYTSTATTARLALTTPPSYFVNRCVLNVITAEYTCAPTDPITFDLTWVRNGIGSISEKTKRVETFGPFTTRFQGEYISYSASVNGTFGGHTAVDLAGNLLDTQSRTSIREITMEAHH